MSSSLVRQLYRRYDSALKPDLIKLIIARLKHWHIPMACWEDMMQEIAIVMIDFSFDSERAGGASERTIVCRKIDALLRTKARSEMRRRAAVDRLSRLSHPEADNARPERAIESEDVRQSIADLTSLQQAICQGLMRGDSVHRIASDTGRSWNTIQRQIGQIKDHLVQRGLSL